MSFIPKLIAFDIDGTILNTSSRLSPATENALRGAMDAGIKVIIATGRMYPSAMKALGHLKIDAPCVFYNGAVLRNPTTGETLWARFMDRRCVSRVLDFYHKNKWYIQIYSNDRLYVADRDDDRCRFYEKLSGIEAIPVGDGIWRFEARAEKLLGISLDELVFHEMHSRTVSRFGSEIYVATSWGRFVEMAHRSVNKARGVERAAASLGIGREDVMAFGDGNNDKEMIEWAGCGVAMANAPDVVRAAADEVTLSNEEDGVAAVINRILQQI